MKALKELLLTGSMLLATPAFYATGMTVDPGYESDTEEEVAEVVNPDSALVVAEVYRPRGLTKSQRRQLDYKWKQSVALFNFCRGYTKEHNEEDDLPKKGMEKIKCLLKNKADFRYKHGGYNNIFHYSHHMPVYLLDLLVRYADTKDINLKGYKDYTPLHYAVRKGDFDQVRILLFAGADPNLTDHLGKKPEEYLSTQNLILYKSILKNIREAEKNPETIEDYTGEPSSIFAKFEILKPASMNKECCDDGLFDYDTDQGSCVESDEDSH